jgi:prevent-host-death family protein
MTEQMLGIAEAKKRFSELVDRVRLGERFVVCRRGKPAVALVSPKEALERPQTRPLGLSAVAGALADWDELEEVVEEIYATRKRARDRSVPDFE